MVSLLPYEYDLMRLPQTLFYPDNNNNDDCNVETKIPSRKDKYSLRPRSARHQENGQDSTKPNTSRKPKQKPPPLSKYRRKNANARERTRMREINQAFETLRKAVPLQMPDDIVGNNEKLTKITTLRLAMQYITSLSATLNSDEDDVDMHVKLFTGYNDFDFFLDSDGESLPLTDQSLLASSPDFPETSLSPVDFDDTLFMDTDFVNSTLEDDFSDFLLT